MLCLCYAHVICKIASRPGCYGLTEAVGGEPIKTGVVSRVKRRRSKCQINPFQLLAGPDCYRVQAGFFGQSERGICVVDLTTSTVVNANGLLICKIVDKTDPGSMRSAARTAAFAIA